MEKFFEGFEKEALQLSRGEEDLATGVTSILPLGTTLHTILKSEKGGDRGKEWLGRMGGSIAGGLGGGLVGVLPGLLLNNPGLTQAGGQVGGIAGGVGGEILANRLVHKGKYDEAGVLKKKHRG